MKYKKTIHIFRRDLRLDDNTALIEAQNNSEQVIPIFIFTPTQIENNDFRSDNSVQFLIESLKSLSQLLEQKSGKLFLFYGEPTEVLSKIINETNAEAIYFNKDYTPFAKNRDKQFEAFCQEQNIACHSFDDALLTPPGSVHKDDGNPYTIYTPFYKKASLQEIAHPKENKKTNYFKKTISFSEDEELFEKILPKSKYNKNILCKGGHNETQTLLKHALTLNDYKDTRNIPSVNGTSKLSAHHKFGTISIREVYWHYVAKYGVDTQFIRELYWRDFATHICFHFPRVFGHAFQTQYENLKWSEDKVAFEKWCNGETGFPIVDAGMRELNTTGYMHNRVRMIVSSFLTKDLHISWQWGEKYFAQKLTDYDPAVNNTSWQWAASTGCDAQPYFRIFNPWLQQKRFDVDCIYVKKWISELSELDASEIHALETQRPITPVDYPKPMLSHKEEKDIAIAMFKSI